MTAMLSLTLPFVIMAPLLTYLADAIIKIILEEEFYK